MLEAQQEETTLTLQAASPPGTPFHLLGPRLPTQPCPSLHTPSAEIMPHHLPSLGAPWLSGQGRQHLCPPMTYRQAFLLILNKSVACLLYQGQRGACDPEGGREVSARRNITCRCSLLQAWGSGAPGGRHEEALGSYERQARGRQVGEGVGLESLKGALAWT